MADTVESGDEQGRKRPSENAGDIQEEQIPATEEKEKLEDVIGDDYSDDSSDDQLMVIETPEGLTLLDTPENSSFYFVPDNEGIESVTESSHSAAEGPSLDSSVVPNQETSITEELLMNMYRMRRVGSPDVPDTVTKLETEDGCKVYVIGTAHFSKDSQEDVSKTIETLQPDAVVVELCKSRVEILRYDEEFLLKEAKNIDLQKLRAAIKQAGVVGGIMQVLLLSMSAHITKQLGMAPGGEFRAAYKEARKVPNCQIHLGDRPIQVTLSRAMAALSIWQKMKLAWHLIMSKEPISAEDVEKCKQKDLLAEMLAEMTGDFPTLYKVFVTERDQFLARTLRLSAVPVHIHGPDGEPQGIIPSVIVGVVGIGHVQGIIDNWGKDVDVQELMKVPTASRTSQLLKLSVKAAFGILLAWGCYRFFRWTNVGSMIPLFR